jgi:hypothetical protein
MSDRSYARIVIGGPITAQGIETLARAFETDGAGAIVEYRADGGVAIGCVRGGLVRCARAQALYEHEEMEQVGGLFEAAEAVATQLCLAWWRETGGCAGAWGDAITGSSGDGRTRTIVQTAFGETVISLAELQQARAGGRTLRQVLDEYAPDRLPDPDRLPPLVLVRERAP